MLKQLCLVLFLFSSMMVWSQGSTSNLKVRKLTPDLKISLAGKDKGAISVKEIIESGGISVNDTNFVVFEFVVSYGINNGMAIRVENIKGSSFPEKILEEIKELKPRSRLQIQQIIVKNSSGSVHELAPIEFKIIPDSVLIIRELQDLPKE